jgi:predicted NBD/HSP70 family sugar kinase
MRKIDLTSFNVATSETARDINRRILLDLIRTRQPISRADLARLSGLHPSTVSLIADQLTEDRWIVEGAFGHLPRGRKPRFLHLNVDRAGIIGVNVRASVTEIGLANLDARFISQESFATPPDFEDFTSTLTERLRVLIDLHPQMFFAGIGISLPGRVNPASKRLVLAPNLGWRDVDIRTPIEEATGLLVEVENVANACALAQLWFQNKTDGISDLAAVTVSEGIGTGIIINGQLVRGASGMAGEFGHTSLNQDGPECKCGKKGCWEVYASNTAAIKEYVSSISSGGSKMQNNGEDVEPSFENLLRLAKQGDTKAAAALDNMAFYLGSGLATLITGIAPGKIVLIGEITRAWEWAEPIIKKVLKERLSEPLKGTMIVPVDAAEQPRLRGSVALILQRHFGAPLVA